jgi:hypothetical protein
MDARRRAAGEATSGKIQAGEKTEGKEGVKDSGRAAVRSSDAPLTQLHIGGATWLHRVYLKETLGLQSMRESAQLTARM